jgi:MGT family glycosyltransferase
MFERLAATLVSYRLRVARIGVVHVPFYSHVEALMRLTNVLVRQGHEVPVWAPESYRERVGAIGARFHLHDPQMPDGLGFMNYAATLAATTERLASELIQEFFDHDLDLLIHDSQVPWARVAGDYLGLPRIVSHPMFPVVSPNHLSDEEEPPEPDPEAGKARFDVHWLAIAQRWGVELGELDSVIHTANAPDETTVAFTTEKVAGDYKKGAGWHCVGPLMEPPPPRQPAGDRPFVYACLGTSFNARVSVFRKVIEGLADQPYDALVSAGGGIVSAADFSALPPNVELRDFVPGREVLARASVFITHCGNNSVHESLLAGVPMVCVPQAYDQFPLADQVQNLGAGVISAEDPESFRAAVEWSLTDEGTRARLHELREHLLSYDGEGRVAALIEQVLDGAPVSA